jgi:excisionase family DNA binding protein
MIASLSMTPWCHMPSAYRMPQPIAILARSTPDSDAGRPAVQEEPGGMPVGEAARALGISVPAVRKRIRRGTLRAYKVDGEWRVIVQPPGQAGGDTDRPGDVTIGEAVAQAARIRHLEEEVAFLRGLVAELVGRVPQLSAPAAAEPMAPMEPPQMPATPPPQRGWLRRWLPW